MTLVTFVRHGNTDWNIEKRAQGHAANPLNNLGRKQAKAAAHKLGKEDWNCFFSSDLLRAVQTAEIISSKINIPAFYCSDLRELDRGQIEGTVEEERIQKWGEEWAKYDLGQETTQSVQNRGVNFLKKVVTQYQGKKILIVGHGFMIAQTLRAIFKNYTQEYKEPDNASITIIEKGKEWRYLVYNDVSHLDV